MKLFGRKIVFPEKGGEFSVGENSDESGCSAASFGGCSEKSDQEVKMEQVTEKDQALGVIFEDKDVDPNDAQESQHTDTSSETEENTRISTMNEVVSEDHIKTENEQSDATNKQKILKKPDKIVPCPRCNSMDTKFCYYNNYNVNQPRHFCKSCQRYWTAGGTMRNVPVGAGRRKSKNSSSYCGHITISEALHAAKIDSPNGAVLSFGPDSSLYESRSSALNLAEKRDGVTDGYYKTNNKENGDDSSFGSSVTMSNCVMDRNAPHLPTMQNINGIPTPCIPGAPLPIPWNSAVPFPAIYPVPFYPTPYWNCVVPSPWNVPWLPVPSPKATGSNPSSPLGKHFRNGELLNSESSIVIPKTLRIDDPEEAAKSSIWSALGIKYDGTSREGLFKALQPKGDSKKLKGVGSPAAFQANPAALSRSIAFQESVPN